MDADAFITPLDADIDHSIQALYAVELRACHILFARSTPLDTDTEYSIHRSTWSDAEIEYSIGSLYVGCGYRMFDSSLYVVGCGNRIFDSIALRWMRIPNVRFIALRGRMRKSNIRFDRSTPSDGMSERGIIMINSNKILAGIAACSFVQIQAKVQAVIKALGIPVQALLSCQDDYYRKVRCDTRCLYTLGILCIPVRMRVIAHPPTPIFEKTIAPQLGWLWEDVESFPWTVRSVFGIRDLLVVEQSNF